MNCIKCDKSVNEVPLHRTKPKGQPDAGWTCTRCINNLPEEERKKIQAEWSDFEHDLHGIFTRQKV